MGLSFILFFHYFEKIEFSLFLFFSIFGLGNQPKIYFMLDYIRSSRDFISPKKRSFSFPFFFDFWNFEFFSQIFGPRTTLTPKSWPLKDSIPVLDLTRRPQFTHRNQTPQILNSFISPPLKTPIFSVSLLGVG